MPFVRPFGGILGDTRRFAVMRDGSQKMPAGRRGNRESQGIVVNVPGSERLVFDLRSLKDVSKRRPWVLAVSATTFCTILKTSRIGSS